MGQKIWRHISFTISVYDSNTVATGYLGRACRTQNVEQRHHKFSNFFQRGKLCEAVRFFCEPKTGGVLQFDKQALDKTGLTDETVA